MDQTRNKDVAWPTLPISMNIIAKLESSKHISTQKVQNRSLPNDSQENIDLNITFTHVSPTPDLANLITLSNQLNMINLEKVVTI